MFDSWICLHRIIDLFGGLPAFRWQRDSNRQHHVCQQQAKLFLEQRSFIWFCSINRSKNRKSEAGWATCWEEIFLDKINWQCSLPGNFRRPKGYKKSYKVGVFEQSIWNICIYLRASEVERWISERPKATFCTTVGWKCRNFCWERLRNFSGCESTIGSMNYLKPQAMNDFANRPKCPRQFVL